MSSFKPKNANAPSTGGDGLPRNFPTPKAGSRRARVSLIVDLGTQEREPFNAGKPDEKPQKPCQQVAVFADLVADTVDYGGDIGKAHYRLMLNGSFGGVLKGINFDVEKALEGEDLDNLLLKIKDACEGRVSRRDDDRRVPVAMRREGDRILPTARVVIRGAGSEGVRSPPALDG